MYFLPKSFFSAAYCFGILFLPQIYILFQPLLELLNKKNAWRNMYVNLYTEHYLSKELAIVARASCPLTSKQLHK